MIDTLFGGLAVFLFGIIFFLALTGLLWWIWPDGFKRDGDRRDNPYDNSDMPKYKRPRWWR